MFFWNKLIWEQKQRDAFCGLPEHTIKIFDKTTRVLWVEMLYLISGV
jgi:hypothetical protein